MAKRKDKNIKIQKNFYKNRPWRRKRKEILQRDNFECQHCKAIGLYAKATTVHHIKHYDKYPELALDDNNLIALCFNCHEAEHPDRLKVYEKKSEIHDELWE